MHDMSAEQGISPSDKKETLGRPDFLFSAEAKKLHKRKNSKFQRRRLKFFRDHVEYFKCKADGSGKPSGSFTVEGVRCELGGDNFVEFEYDDLNARKYVFLIDCDLVKAQMMWITNGEQYNNYQPTFSALRQETVKFMTKCLHNYPVVNELVARKYKAAHKYFMGVKVSGTPTKRIYEDPDSVGFRIPTDTSSSGSDGESEAGSVTSDKGLSRTTARKVENAFQGPIVLSKEASFDETELSSSSGQNKSIKSMKFGNADGLVEDEEQYMSIEDFGFRGGVDETMLGQSHVKSRKRECVYTKGELVPSHGQIATTIQLCSDHKHIDVASLEVNAIKARISGDRDFIEIDVSEIGKTLKDLHQTLCKEFDILPEEIGCIVRLPDVRIRNDKDVQRIRSGRMLEIEILEEH